MERARCGKWPACGCEDGVQKPSCYSHVDKESSTPRTDAEIASCDETLPFTLAAGDKGRSLYGQVCRASFARQLERELASVREAGMKSIDRERELEAKLARATMSSTAPTKERP